MLGEDTHDDDSSIKAGLLIANAIVATGREQGAKLTLIIWIISLIGLFGVIIATVHSMMLKSILESSAKPYVTPTMLREVQQLNQQQVTVERPPSTHETIRQIAADKRASLNKKDE